MPPSCLVFLRKEGSAVLCRENLCVWWALFRPEIRWRLPVSSMSRNQQYILNTVCFSTETHIKQDNVFIKIICMMYWWVEKKHWPKVCRKLTLYFPESRGSGFANSVTLPPWIMRTECVCYKRGPWVWYDGESECKGRCCRRQQREALWGHR